LDSSSDADLRPDRVTLKWLFHELVKLRISPTAGLIKEVFPIYNISALICDWCWRSLHKLKLLLFRSTLGSEETLFFGDLYIADLFQISTKLKKYFKNLKSSLFEQRNYQELV